jgi:hypothetical protein
MNNNVKFYLCRDIQRETSLLFFYWDFSETLDVLQKNRLTIHLNELAKKHYEFIKYLDINFFGFYPIDFVRYYNSLDECAYLYELKKEIVSDLNIAEDILLNSKLAYALVKSDSNWNLLSNDSTNHVIYSTGWILCEIDINEIKNWLFTEGVNRFSELLNNVDYIKRFYKDFGKTLKDTVNDSIIENNSCKKQLEVLLVQY